MNNENNDIIEIDLLRLLQVLLSRIWTIGITAVIGGVIAFIYAYFLITPKYESSALFYVNNNSINIGSSSYSISSGDISASQSLVDTYIVILNTRSTLESVIRKNNLKYTYEQLKDMISASAVNSTEVFKVTVNTTNADEACKIANGIAKVLPDKISEIVTGSGAKVVDYAVVEPNKVSPSLSKYTLIGILLGLVISCGVIVLEDIFDDSIRDDSTLLSQYPDVPVLAVIPNLNSEGGQYYYSKDGKYQYYKQTEEKK